MKWIVVSDSHGLQEPLVELKEKYRDADGFIHCGDSELPVHLLEGYFAVLGNNDYFEPYPEYLVVTMGKHRALVVHGHRAGISNRNQFLAKQARGLNCDLVFFGHSHVFCDEMVDGVRIMNPGSLWRSRDGRGKTYGVFEIDEHDQMSFTCMNYASGSQRRRWGW